MRGPRQQPSCPWPPRPANVYGSRPSHSTPPPGRLANKPGLRCCQDSQRPSARLRALQPNGPWPPFMDVGHPLVVQGAFSRRPQTSLITYSPCRDREHPPHFPSTLSVPSGDLSSMASQPNPACAASPLLSPHCLPALTTSGPALQVSRRRSTPLVCRPSCPGTSLSDFRRTDDIRRQI